MTAGRTSRSRPGRRVDPQLAPAFAKDPAEERLLDHLNAILAPYEEEDYLDLEERFPTLHLVGVPRSGTTLLHQAVVSGLEIGYVNNLVAAFWRAPVYGIRLSRKLGIDPSSSSFDSRYGRTRGVGEPHEFGYFWNAHLGYADLSEQPLEHEASIDFAHLARVLRNMAEANGGPMVFKPMLLIWHLEAIRREMPRSCFVWIQRDQRATALSLLGMRRSVFGSVNAWASLRPRISADVPLDTPARQVVAQVLLLDRAIQRGRDRSGDEAFLRVDYRDLCSAPGRVLEQVRDLLGSKGHAPAWRDRTIRSFEPRHDAALDAEFGDEVDEALAVLQADEAFRAEGLSAP